MPSPFKKSRSNDLPDKIKELIQSLSKEEDRKLFTNIYKKVTKKEHKHPSPQKGDRTITECIELFEQGANPEVLTELKKSLRERLEKSPEKQEEHQKHYKYYIENFLPALKDEVIKSEELAVPTVFNNEREQSQRPQTIRGKILEIILGIIKRSSNKDHSSSTIQNQNGRRNNQIERQDNATGLFKNKSFSSEVAISTSSDMTPQEKDSVGKGVSGKGISGTYNPLRSSGYYSASTTPTLKQLQASEEKVSIAQSQLNGSFSQSCEDLENEDPSTTADAVEVPSDANTSKLSGGNDSDSGIDSPRKSEESSRSPVSSRRSSISSTEENNNSQKGDTGNQIQQEQDALEEPQVQESGNSSGQANPDQVKKDILLKKQPNNRNLHVALVAGCALSTIGCIVAGAMTSGLVGAGLLAMAAVFAIAAVAELHSNFLSSKLTSINVSPLVDDKELTAL